MKVARYIIGIIMLILAYLSDRYLQDEELAFFCFLAGLSFPCLNATDEGRH